MYAILVFLENSKIHKFLRQTHVYSSDTLSSCGLCVVWLCNLAPFEFFCFSKKFFKNMVFFKRKAFIQLITLALNSSSWDSLFCFSYSVSFAINPIQTFLLFISRSSICVLLICMFLLTCLAFSLFEHMKYSYNL